MHRASDRSPALDRFVRMLALAVHGGPAPAVAAVARGLRALGLRCPLDVLAIQGRGGLRAPAPWRLLRLHPGLAYACAPRGSDRSPLRGAVRRARGILGDPSPCADAGGLVRAIQQAILALRRIEQGGPGGACDAAEEERRRIEALRAVARADPGWRQTAAAWLDVVFDRHHQRAINHIRRRLAEFCCSCTAAHGEESPDLPYASWRCLEGLTGTYVLGELRRRYLEDLARVVAAVAAPIDHPARVRGASPAVRRAWEHLRAHRGTPLRVAAVAAAAGVSAGHLSRAFRRELGTSVLRCGLDMRLELARGLLVSTRRDVLDIALSSGFGSAAHFHRCFKRRYGLTPRRLRAARAIDLA